MSALGVSLDILASTAGGNSLIGSSAGLSSEQLKKIKRLERNKVRVNLFIRACRVVYANKVRFFLQVRIKENLYSYFFLPAYHGYIGLLVASITSFSIGFDRCRY